MRIRQIKPAFWTDVRLAELPPAVRLTFIGLWMIADDAGWFRYDPAQVANELYGYESRRRRERTIAADVEALEVAGRVNIYPCGHAQVPHLTEHQRLAGETHRVLTIQREHSHCPAVPRDSPLVPDTVRNGSGTLEERKVMERNVAREAEPSGSPRSEFSQKVPRSIALGGKTA